jgi:hypothetical protein
MISVHRNPRFYRLWEILVQHHKQYPTPPIARNRQTKELGSKTLILYKVAEPDKSQLPGSEVVTLRGLFPWNAFAVKKGDF